MPPLARPTFDETDAAQVSDALAWFAGFQAPQVEFEEDALRIAERACDPRVRSEAWLLAASVAHFTGRHEVAERRYLAGFRQHRGRSSPLEVRGLVNLGNMCLHDGRLYEAAALSERALRAGSASRDTFVPVLAELNLAGTLVSLGAHAAALDRLLRIEERVAHLSEERVRQTRFLAAVVRLEIAESAEDEAGILENTAIARSSLEPSHVLGDLLLDLLAQGCTAPDWSAVQARLADISWRERLPLDVRLRALQVEWRLTRRRGARSDLADVVDRMLELIRSSGRDATDCSLAWVYGLALRKDLARVERTVAWAKRRATLDAALGELAVLRTWQLEEVRHSLDELCVESPDVVAALRSCELRCGPALSRTVGALSRSMEAALAVEEPHDARQGRIMTVCAWCNRFRGPDGLWIALPAEWSPTGELVPHVSHGACANCADSIRRS